MREPSSPPIGSQHASGAFSRCFRQREVRGSSGKGAAEAKLRLSGQRTPSHPEPIGPQAFIDFGANGFPRARRMVASGLTAPRQPRQ